jgi:hypothetical protein
MHKNSHQSHQMLEWFFTRHGCSSLEKFMQLNNLECDEIPHGKPAASPHTVQGQKNTRGRGEE